MNKTLSPGPRTGCVTAPASKSHAQRLLICAALGERETRIACRGISRDIRATIDCLNALGADVRETDAGTLLVKPIRSIPAGLCVLPCGESGATLRFLLPLVGAIGAEVRFLREGRLPVRPLEPLNEELRRHGMMITEDGDDLVCKGQLRPGKYRLPGNISSQFFSGLLMALPLLMDESRVCIRGSMESSSYVDMTLDVLRSAGIEIRKEPDGFYIPAGRRPRLPETVAVEGDWSGAASFLCMGALSRSGVTLRALSKSSLQGDRAILELLAGFGAKIRESERGITVSRSELRGLTVDAAQIPDLIPALCALGAAAEGEIRIVNAARLRMKESDRLSSTAEMLRALGAEVLELADGLVIRARGCLRGGVADCALDHRIVMAAAVAACACREPVEILHAECTEKSYPGFWEEWDSLEGEEL